MHDSSADTAHLIVLYQLVVFINVISIVAVLDLQNKYTKSYLSKKKHKVRVSFKSEGS